MPGTATSHLQANPDADVLDGITGSPALRPKRKVCISTGRRLH